MNRTNAIRETDLFLLALLLLLLLLFLLPSSYYSSSSSGRVVPILCNSRERLLRGRPIRIFLEKKVSKGITDVQSLYTRLKEKLICILTQHVYEVTWVNRIPVSFNRDPFTPSLYHVLFSIYYFSTILLFIYIFFVHIVQDVNKTRAILHVVSLDIETVKRVPVQKYHLRNIFSS